MLASRTNTLALRLAAGAALLLVFVAMVFGALLSAISSARQTDHDTTRSRQAITALASARQQVVGARAADRVALRRANRAVGNAAAAVEASPYLDTALAAEIRPAGNAFESDPATFRADLTRSLSAAIAAQDTASVTHSDDLDSALTRALLLGLFGLAGTILTLFFFGADVRRSLVRPLRNLITGARRLGGGDLSTRVPEAGVDDLKALARALNSMAVSLDATRKTLDTQHAQITSSRAETDRATTAKNEFLSRMSHELRTPLNAILGFSEVMKNEVFGPHASPSYREYAGDIHGSGEHLLTLINEILDLSRIEAGRYDLSEEAVQLPYVVEDCRHMLNLRAKAKNQTIREMIDPTLPRLWADERALRQIVLNVLSNAIKFTPPGGEIAVKVGWTSSGGQYLSVKDTGPGIPEEEIPIVMQSFGRGSLAIKTAEQGSGLGLPIVKGLVDIHGGGFQLKSKPREGTEVIVTFPAARVMDALPAVEVEAAKGRPRAA
ncbi:MAG: ATP-binding protein [Microvirga sp.]